MASHESNPPTKFTDHGSAPSRVDEEGLTDPKKRRDSTYDPAIHQWNTPIDPQPFPSHPAQGEPTPLPRSMLRVGMWSFLARSRSDRDARFGWNKARTRNNRCDRPPPVDDILSSVRATLNIGGALLPPSSASNHTCSGPSDRTLFRNV